MFNKTVFTIKLVLLILLGLSHLLMREILPVDGGGLSLIFVLTIPALFVLSGIFSWIVYWMYKTEKDALTQHLFFAFFIFILSYITFGMFPYA